MNKIGQVRGFALLLVVFLIALTLFGLIEAFKETLDNNRGGTAGGTNQGLNCPGTISFNDADYQNDTTLEKLTRRPTCFVTGISMVYFIFYILIASVVWLVANWKK